MRKSAAAAGALLIGLLLSSPAVFAQGQLKFPPVSGPVGAKVHAVATGLPPGEPATLIWHTASPEWRVTGEAQEEFHGYEAKDRQIPITTVHADAEGKASFEFTIPEDFGWLHNVTLEHDGEVLARQGFLVVKSMTIEPASGPVGTPIHVKVTGLGYRTYQVLYHLLYDNAYAGLVTALTTGGTAELVIPATGLPGAHTIQILNGALTTAYLNIEQSPNYIPGASEPLFAVFTITEGPAVIPEPFEEQGLPRVKGEGGAPSASRGQNAPGAGATPRIAFDYVSGQVGDPVVVTGSGFPAGADVELLWETVVGNRVGGRGWERRSSTLAHGRTDSQGSFSIETRVPDDLGGAHLVTAVAAGVRAEGAFTITPSVVKFSPTEVAPGERFVLQFKGIGWTETENILTVVHDNAYIGYACGFNTQGDVTLYLRAAAEPGWHYIDVYPAIYKGDLGGINIDPFRTPMLNAADHPGAEIPVFRLAYYVRAE